MIEQAEMSRAFFARYGEPSRAKLFGRYSKPSRAFFPKSLSQNWAEPSRAKLSFGLDPTLDFMAFNLEFQIKYALNPWCKLFRNWKVPFKVFLTYLKFSQCIIRYESYKKVLSLKYVRFWYFHKYFICGKLVLVAQIFPCKFGLDLFEDDQNSTYHW